MSKTLTDTQLVLLSSASQREDHCLTPPTGARLGPARKAVAKLLEAGLVREIGARKNVPVWRCDEETEQAFALKLTTRRSQGNRRRSERGHADSGRQRSGRTRTTRHRI